MRARRRADDDLVDVNFRRLTDRERETAMLIGEGLSNRDIAARLTLSLRTVENHIYKAMAKTGTTSRDELANLLRRHGPTTQ